MFIKNLTSKKQKLVVRELTEDRREYEIYVEPSGATHLDNLMIDHPEKYEGIFDIEGCCCTKRTPVVLEVSIEETPEGVTEIPQEEEEEEESTPEETQETTVEETSTETSEFVCEICGAEFGSARGLSSHKNKAHAE